MSLPRLTFTLFALVTGIGLAVGAVYADRADDGDIVLSADEFADNAHWHRPASSDEAIFVGRQGEDPVRLGLDKAAIVDGSLRVRLRSDARQLVLRAGDESITLPMRRDNDNELTLTGEADQPWIVFNGHRREAERGQWIRLLHRVDAPHLVIELPEASYANIEFSDSPAAAESADARPHASQDDRAAQRPAAGVSASPTTRARRVPPAGDAQRYRTPADVREELAYSHPVSLSIDAGVENLSSYYYRGLGRENSGPIIHPYADTSVRVFSSRHDTWYDYADLRIGVQTAHHWGPYGGETGERWVELNWYGGVAFGAFDRWEAELLYVNRESVRTFFQDVHQLDFTVRYDDSDPDYAWSLQPHMTFTLEYEHQSDGGWLSEGLSDELSRGLYLEFGVTPTAPLATWLAGEPITLSVPTRVGLSLSDYFEDPEGRDSTFGYFQTGVAVNVPLYALPAEGGRRFMVSLDGGVDVITFGSSVRRFNRAAGVGDSSVDVIGRLGLNVNF